MYFSNNSKFSTCAGVQLVKYLELGLMENKSANYKKISLDKVATLKYWIESAV